MLGQFLARAVERAVLGPAVIDPTVPPTTVPSTVPATTVPVPPPDPTPIETSQTFGSSVADVVSSMWDNLGDNPYQTAAALIVATLTVVAMVNLKVNIVLIIPVAIGAFWAGWLGWNTITAQDNPLFPGDVSANKIWDVATSGGTGFLIVVGTACVAAVFLWRKGTPLASRILLVLGAVLGASFVYNLVEAIRVA